jgi:dihydroorotase
MNLLIKSATIIDKSQASHHLKKRDILIEKGTIKAIESQISGDKKTEVFKAENLCVSPGWLDSSVSFGEPGYEERETIANGLKVAGKNGYTAVILNTNTKPKPDTSGDIVFLRETAKKHVTGLYPMGTVSLESRGEALSEMYDMHLAGAVAFSDYKNSLNNPNLLKLALLYTQNFNGLVYSFPQDGQLSPHGQMHEGEVSLRLGLRGIPALSESLRVARDLAILEYTGGKLHIPTISTGTAVNMIGAAKKKGLDVSCSVAIHHLWHTDEVLDGFDSFFKTLPPLRDKKEVKSLQKGLKDGIIDFVTSDHCPMDVEEKRREFDQAGFGATGLEETFGILNQIFDVESTCEILSRGRDRFGLEEVSLNIGQQANLTLFNPEIEYILAPKDMLSTSKNSMFLGVPLKGKAYGIIRGDKMIL